MELIATGREAAHWVGIAQDWAEERVEVNRVLHYRVP